MLQKMKKLLREREKHSRALRWLMSISKPFISSILFVILLKCAISGLGILSAAINKNIVDMAGAVYGFEVCVILAIACTVLSIVLSIAFNLISVYLTERYSCNVRTRMYRHIMNAAWTERGAYHSGDFLTRLTNDMSVVAGGVVDVSANVIATVIQFVMAFALLWHYDSSLAMVGVLTGPVIAIVTIILASKLGELHNKIQETESEYRIFLQEQFTQTDTVKVFEQEKQCEEKFTKIQENRMYWIQKRNRTKLIASAIISIVFSGTYLFAFCMGAVKINAGIITYGTMTAFLSLIGQVQTPMYTLANLMPRMVGTVASAGRIMKIPEMRTEEIAQEGKLLSGAIGVCGKGMVLSYGDKRIISGLDLDVKPGEFVMIKGSSGVGKTTLIRSILGFIEPEEGSLAFYDAEGTASKCSADTRKYISYVPQGNTLFNGTIEENLKMGNPEATEQQMQNALEVACAWDFISNLPDKLKTKIGEKSHGLSEGQAQRIAIARALLKPAGIIIMDESTSALDSDTEERILNALKSNIGKKSCLFVSHRESVSRIADRVLVVENTIED